ncbi:MAG: hypothetical protein PVJ60_04390 [Phycisphaerales bacterium]|jgi:hypothetical protein
MFDDIKADNNDASKEAAKTQGPVPSPKKPLNSTNGFQAGSKEEDKGGNIGATSTTPSSPAKAPQEQGGETEDIFAQVDQVPEPKVKKPPVFQPKAPAAGSPVVPEASSAPKESSFKKIVALVILILGLGGIGYGSYWAITEYILTSPEESAEITGQMETTEKPATTDEEPVMTEPAQTAPEDNEQEPDAAPSNLLDTDNDGLTDQEEIGLGTDLSNVDSDDDGLFDREEVRTYGTDPLNSDSDGDGFLDGEEVKEGYNPLGPGRLYDVGDNN